jgi:Flp pilus assembly protein TadG
MTPTARWCTGSRGQALVETALVLPVLVLLLLALFDFGRAVYAWNTVGNAAREGGRVATVNQIEMSTGCDRSKPITNPSTPAYSIKACAIAAAAALQVAESDVTVSYANPPTQASLGCTSSNLSLGCTVDVTVETTWQPISPWIRWIVGDSITMSHTSQTTIERIFP